ncbi:MAG: hypothetical protein LKI39_12730 [Bacteroides sp.]|jgi:hypothetical protein|nr:hypothetical protein [Bacteroides sp.]MCI1683402.1 hypothetical protein [Bacteroides sp.]
MEFNYDDNSVKELLEWARSTKFPKTLRLSNYENIFDLSKYIHANISDIEQHYPDPFYNISIDRLYRVKEMLQVNV